MIQLAMIGSRVDASTAQPIGHALGIADGQGVDDTAAVDTANRTREPGKSRRSRKTATLSC